MARPLVSSKLTKKREMLTKDEDKKGHLTQNKLKELLQNTRATARFLCDFRKHDFPSIPHFYHHHVPLEAQ